MFEQQRPSILRNGATKVDTDIDICTLSSQEAAFGLLVHLFHFLSKTSFPLQQVQLSRSERTEEQ